MRHRSVIALFAILDCSLQQPNRHMPSVAEAAVAAAAGWVAAVAAARWVVAGAGLAWRVEAVAAAMGGMSRPVHARESAGDAGKPSAAARAAVTWGRQ